MARDDKTSRSRQRGKPVQVQAKTPWGFIAGATVLGLLLVGVLVYAVMNSGSGFEDPLKRADESVEGVVVSSEETLSRDHVAGPVRYEQNPPNGGDHNGVPQVCRVYEQPIPSEHAVHSMEHGAAWITYKPDLPAAQVKALREMAEGDAYILMSPFPDQKSPINLSAWGRRLSVESASDERVEQFLDTYKNGPQTPEKGASCSVGNSSTGTVPAGAAAVPPGAPQGTAEVPVG